MPSGRVVALALAVLLTSGCMPMAFGANDGSATQFIADADGMEVGQGARDGDGPPLDPWNETPFRTIAVPEGISHMTTADYSDVAVVINNMSDASRTIGYAFASARGIPTERILLLTNESTPTSETIDADDYDDFFAAPISQMLHDRNLTGVVNVFVTTKGVPLRVNGGTNARASFDSELALLDSSLPVQVHDNWWGSHDYGPWSVTAPNDYGIWSDQPLQSFERSDEGFYIVTRLTGYNVETALGLIDKANSSYGNRGLGVLDLATNRNGSGYKFWNDALYLANKSWNETLGEPVHFNLNSTFLTGLSDVMMYASWGSNDGSWDSNHLPNANFDTSDSAWSTGSLHWEGSPPPLAANETFEWSRQTAVKRSGSAALEGTLSSAPCTTSEASITGGLLAEYFDNAGLSFNRSLMPDLTGRSPDHWRIETHIDVATTRSPWSGLDSRFADYWSVRHTGAITIPESGEWTFYLNSDDGTKLWIDDVEVVDNQGEHSMREVSGSTNLTAGVHDFHTEFFEWGGWAGFTLSWQGPNQSKQVVPPSAFTRGTGGEVAVVDLIHHWSFDETGGLVANDSAGDAHLNISGSNGSAWEPCLFGNCLRFDGIDDYARVDVDDWGGNFSIELWVNTDNQSQDRYSSVIAVNDVAGDDASFQIMASGGADGDWEFYNNASRPFGAIDAGAWTHLVATFANGTLRMYMDGQLVSTSTEPNGTIDSIELYKFGVNRAGSTHYEGLIDEVRVWNRTLTGVEIDLLDATGADECLDYTGSGNATTHVNQTYDLPMELKGHAWIIYGYAQREGWIHGDWWIEVDGLDANGSVVSSNISDANDLAYQWNSRTMRFRPAENATSLRVRMVADIDYASRNGSIFFDQMNLRAIRPHMDWMDGSIAETAVSTGGRTFTWGATYGQSLVADILEDGASGVKGYVYEPYLSTVSDPYLLASYYGAGYTLGEAYWASNPAISWMGVVVGDPKMAAYSDRLHDVHVIDARTDGRLSSGSNGSIEVMVENLGGAEANGWLEIRERIGQVVLTNVSLTLPPGDADGSRTIVELPVKTQRQGFVEFVVEYIADHGQRHNRTGFVQPIILKEHHTDNNRVYLNPRVNAPPSIDSFWCSSSLGPRGSTVSCQIVASDEFGVDSVRFGWRHEIDAQDAESISWMATTEASAGVWRVSLDIPVDMALGSLDVFAEVSDVDGLVASRVLLEAIRVVDASATWFGIHVDGADPPDWSGAVPLPAATFQGIHRGEVFDLRACVIDPDHDVGNETPRFLAQRGLVSPVVVEDVSGNATSICYSAMIMLDPGSSLDPLTLTLNDHEGYTHSVRTIAIENSAPTGHLELIRGGEVVTVSSAVGESIRVVATDEDDPGSSLQGELRVTWPGDIERSVEFTIGANESSVDVLLPSGDPPMQAGSVEVTVMVRDQLGAESSVQRQWLVHRLAPNVTATVCGEWNGTGWASAEEGTVHRGVDALLLVSILPKRDVLFVRASLSQSGWATTLTTLQDVIPERCIADSGDGFANGEHRMFVVSVDPSLVEGAAALEVTVTDVDMLRSDISFPVTIAYPGPSIEASEWIGELRMGVATALDFEVKDPDDLADVICTLRTVDAEGTMMLDLVLHPAPDGLVQASWIPSRSVEGASIEARCADGSGREAVALLTNVTVLASESPVKSDDPPVTGEESESSAAGWAPIAGIGGVILLALLVVSTLLLRGGRAESDWERPADGPVVDSAWDEEESNEPVAKAVSPAGDDVAITNSGIFDTDGSEESSGTIARGFETPGAVESLSLEAEAGPSLASPTAETAGASMMADGMVGDGAVPEENVMEPDVDAESLQSRLKEPIGKQGVVPFVGDKQRIDSNVDQDISNPPTASHESAASISSAESDPWSDFDFDSV